jgi:menaquinone-dependent protoporphyrinogen oxidase
VRCRDTTFFATTRDIPPIGLASRKHGCVGAANPFVERGTRLAASVGMATKLTLPSFPVFFATSEGQTRLIAERFASILRQDGLESAAYDVADLHGVVVDWAPVRGAIVGASIHVGKHQRSVTDFVAANVDELNQRSSLFFSVSLAAASQNREEVQKAQEIANAFPSAHGWKPQAVISLAGRLAYSQYNFIVRLLLKRIARKEGAPTDTSRDYEFTNWTRVEAIAHEFAARAKARIAA